MSNRNNRQDNAPQGYQSYHKLPAVLVTSNNLTKIPVPAEGGKTYQSYQPGVSSHTHDPEQQPQPERTSVIFLDDLNEFKGSRMYSIGDLEGSQVINVRDFEALDHGGPELDKLTDFLLALTRPRNHAPLEQDDYDEPADNSEGYFYSPNNTNNTNNPPDVYQRLSGEGTSTPKVVGVGNVLRRLGRKLTSIRKGKQPAAQGVVPNEHTFIQPRPGPAKRTRFLHQATDDRDLWPDGMRWAGRDGGEDGRCYYIDQYGVRWQSEEGCTHGTVTEM